MHLKHLCLLWSLVNIKVKISTLSMFIFYFIYSFSNATSYARIGVYLCVYIIFHNDLLPTDSTTNNELNYIEQQSRFCKHSLLLNMQREYEIMNYNNNLLPQVTLVIRCFNTLSHIATMYGRISTLMYCTLNIVQVHYSSISTQ